MPSDDIEGCVVLIVLEELAVELRYDRPLLLIRRDAVVLLIRCYWRLEVSFVRTAIGSDRSKVRNAEVSFVYFSHPTTVEVILSLSFNVVLDSAGNHDDLFRPDVQFAKLCRYVKCTLLWNNNQVSISGIERCP